MTLPITEEDAPAVERMILQLKRLRKRDAEHRPRANNGSSYGNPNLDDAINGLMEFGAIKGWWKD